MQNNLKKNLVQNLKSIKSLDLQSLLNNFIKRKEEKKKIS